MIRPPFTLVCLLLLPAWIWSGCGAVQPLPFDDRKESAASAAKPSEIDLSSLYWLFDRNAEDEALSALHPMPETGKKKAKKSPKNEKPIEKAAQEDPEPPTVLQDVQGPEADDQLLDQLGKDLDQAMQLPPGRRKIPFSLELVENERVKFFIKLFSGRWRGFFTRALTRSGRYVPMMTTILEEEGLPTDLVYLSLIESGFSPRAYSRAKAVGPWQFIHGTGSRYGLKINGWIDERRDPVKSTRAAAAYLKDLHGQFGEWFLAAAAYNAGEGKVEKAVQRSQTNDFWLISKKRRLLKRETRNYVPKFIAAALIASEPEKYGFLDIPYESPWEYEEVTIQDPLWLKTVAKMAGTSVKTIKELNPALLLDFTPPDHDEFVLRVPAGSSEQFYKAYEILPESAKLKAKIHTVRRGESLGKIARRYRQPAGHLRRTNGLKSWRVRPGQKLVIISNGVPKKGPVKKRKKR